MARLATKATGVCLLKALPRRLNCKKERNKKKTTFTKGSKLANNCFAWVISGGQARVCIVFGNYNITIIKYGTDCKIL